MTLCLMLLTHFIADFLLQSRTMGQKKSSSLKYLLAHISIIFVCFLPFGLKFAALNAIIHMVIDGSIWNLYKLSVAKRFPEAIKNPSEFKYYEDHLFYSTIGFDQMLHSLTIVILYGVL